MHKSQHGIPGLQAGEDVKLHSSRFAGPFGSNLARQASLSSQSSSDFLLPPIRAQTPPNKSVLKA